MGNGERAGTWPWVMDRLGWVPIGPVLWRRQGSMLMSPSLAHSLWPELLQTGLEGRLWGWGGSCQPLQPCSVPVLLAPGS